MSAGRPFVLALGRKATLFARDERGATAIEYTLIAGIMAVAVVGAFSLLKDPLVNLFQTIGQNFTSV